MGGRGRPGAGAGWGGVEVVWEAAEGMAVSAVAMVAGWVVTAWVVGLATCGTEAPCRGRA